MPARKKKDHDNDEYKKKRERNNLAVKKCRIKSSEKIKDTRGRINALKDENKELENKMQLLQEKVRGLKEIILMKSEDKEKIDEILAEDGLS